MVKAKTTTKALTGPRQLKLMVPEYSGAYAEGSGFPAENGWKAIFVNPSVYYESYIDVNLAMDDLTMFPQAAILQDPGIYTKTDDSADLLNSLQVIDIVSTKQLDPTTLVSNIVTGNAASAMLGTDDDFNQIIMGTWRLMAVNSNLGLSNTIHTTVDVKDFSSASPFAQDRLWFYRFLIPIKTIFPPGDVLGCPASRFVVQVIVGQEDDLPYMMRLKNSYELQQL